jgi:hypothetical protein
MSPTAQVKARKHLWLWSVFLGAAFFVIFYFGNGVIQSTDSRYVFPTVISLMNQGNLDVDEFFDKPGGVYQPSDYHLEVIQGRHYNWYPIGQVLVAAPFVFVANKLAGVGYQSDPAVHKHLELLVACIIAAGACMVIFLLARLRLDTFRAILLTAVIGLGTSVWSTASCGLWQHGPSIFLLTLALYLLLAAENRPQLVQYVGIPLVLSYLMRPTNAIPVAIFTVYIWWKYRQYFVTYLVMSSIVAVPFVLFNLFMYHSLLSRYYTPGSLGIPRHVSEAILGMLISPSRGLFVFSPILLFSLYGIVLKLRPGHFELLDVFVLLIPIGHVLATALSNPMWWAGHSFGPRLMTDVIPFFAYFLIPVLEDSSNWKGFKAVYMWGALALALLFSSFVHFTGAFSPQAWSWNSQPTNIDQDTARLWDWCDSQAFRAVKIWLHK